MYAALVSEDHMRDRDIIFALIASTHYSYPICSQPEAASGDVISSVAVEDYALGMHLKFGDYRSNRFLGKTPVWRLDFM